MSHVFEVLVVDNRDSFVFNLTDDLARLEARCTVVRGNIAREALERWLATLRPDLVLLSPGPGDPREAGVMVPFLAGRPRLPILGVCLGMQAMVCALGGRLGRLENPAHGRTSRVVHEGDPLFAGLPRRFTAGRYHSLVAESLPRDLRAIAWTADRDPEGPRIMAVRHRELPWWGLQFHPESILSPDGPVVLRNVLRLACEFR